MKVLSARQLRTLDAYTIQHEPVTSLQLMERAAVAMCQALTARFDNSHRIVMMCGPGNNGGDGLAMARLLAEQSYTVECYLFNTKGKLSPDCDTNRLALPETVEFHEVTSSFTFPTLDRRCVVIDALFGTGLSRPLDGGFVSLVRAINASEATVVSIDTPSGLMSEDNSYNNRQNVVRASLTLTLHRPKLAHLFPENEQYVGHLEVLPIGLLPEGEEELDTPYYITELEEISAMRRLRPRFAHKGLMGNTLLLAGSQGMAGAAILAARACLRAGTGKVTVATSQASIVPLQVAVPEAVVKIGTGPVNQDMSGRYNAVGMGPGMGTTDLSATALHLIRHAGCPIVLDADALNLLSGHSEWFSLLPQGSILTPHVKELERIVGRCPDSMERMRRALSLATHYGIYVLIKGHYSMVCTPCGNVYFNPTGGPAMATAGSGDVLTGIVTSLLGQGYKPEEALRMGAWLHGAAGDLAVQTLGCEESVTATDIINHISKAFALL